MCWVCWVCLFFCLFVCLSVCLFVFLFGLFGLLVCWVCWVCLFVGWLVRSFVCLCTYYICPNVMVFIPLVVIFISGMVFQDHFALFQNEHSSLAPRIRYGFNSEQAQRLFSRDNTTAEELQNFSPGLQWCSVPWRLGFGMVPDVEHVR